MGGMEEIWGKRCLTMLGQWQCPTIKVLCVYKRSATSHHLWFIKRVLLTDVGHPQHTPFSQNSTDYTVLSYVIQEWFHSITSKQPMWLCEKETLRDNYLFLPKRYGVSRDVIAPDFDKAFWLFHKTKLKTFRKVGLGPCVY